MRIFQKYFFPFFDEILVKTKAFHGNFSVGFKINHNPTPCPSPLLTANLPRLNESRNTKQTRRTKMSPPCVFGQVDGVDAISQKHFSSPKTIYRLVSLRQDYPSPVTHRLACCSQRGLTQRNLSNSCRRRSLCRGRASPLHRRVKSPRPSEKKKLKKKYLTRTPDRARFSSTQVGIA